LTSIAVQNNQAAAGIESALRTPTDDRTAGIELELPNVKEVI